MLLINSNHVRHLMAYKVLMCRYETTHSPPANLIVKSLFRTLMNNYILHKSSLSGQT